MGQRLLVQAFPRGGLSAVGCRGSFIRCWQRKLLAHAASKHAWMGVEAEGRARVSGCSKATLSYSQDCRGIARLGSRVEEYRRSEGRRTMKPRVARRRVLFCRCRTISECGRENADCRVCLEMAKGGWDMQERRPRGEVGGRRGGCRGSVGTCLLTPRELPAKGCGRDSRRQRWPGSRL